MTTTPYRPSNGTEGECFMSKFCEQCKRDINQDCSIITATMAFDISDPEYPAEWVEDESGPRCTAFEPIGDAAATPRCDKTVDMFPETPA